MQQPTFILAFTEAQLNVIGNALSERPFKEVAPVLQSINQQLEARSKAMTQMTQAATATPQPEPDVVGEIKADEVERAA